MKRPLTRAEYAYIKADFDRFAKPCCEHCRTLEEPVAVGGDFDWVIVCIYCSNDYHEDKETMKEFIARFYN